MAEEDREAKNIDRLLSKYGLQSTEETGYELGILMQFLDADALSYNELVEPLAKDYPDKVPKFNASLGKIEGRGCLLKQPAENPLYTLTTIGKLLIRELKMYMPDIEP